MTLSKTLNKHKFEELGKNKLGSFLGTWKGFQVSPQLADFWLHIGPCAKGTQSERGF